LKHTWNWHRDFDNLTKAVKTVKAIGETINEKIREVEEMNKCQHKEKSISGIPKVRKKLSHINTNTHSNTYIQTNKHTQTIVKPGRRFVDETSFSIISKSQHHHIEKFKVFLFTDILLWTRKSKFL
jgi:hypothetical protein